MSVSVENKIISVRYRTVREMRKISRTELAGLLKIPGPRLQSYEVGRAPLPAEIGLRTCQILEIDQFWLGGGGRHFGGFIIMSFEGIEPKEKETYLEFYHRILKPREKEILHNPENSAHEDEAIWNVEWLNITKKNLNKAIDTLIAIEEGGALDKLDSVTTEILKQTNEVKRHLRSSIDRLSVASRVEKRIKELLDSRS